MSRIVNPPTVVVQSDAELLAKATAARLVTRLVDAQAMRGTASLVLTGGGIGIAVLEQLALAPARDAIDWSRVDRLAATPQPVPVAVTKDHPDLPAQLGKLVAVPYDRPPYGMDANNAVVSGQASPGN